AWEGLTGVDPARAGVGSLQSNKPRSGCQDARRSRPGVTCQDDPDRQAESRPLVEICRDGSSRGGACQPHHRLLVAGENPLFVKGGVLHALALLDEITVDGMDRPVLRLNDRRIVVRAALVIFQMPGVRPGATFVIRE